MPAATAASWQSGLHAPRRLPRPKLHAIQRGCWGPARQTLAALRVPRRDSVLPPRSPTGRTIAGQSLKTLSLGSRCRGQDFRRRRRASSGHPGDICSEHRPAYREKYPPPVRRLLGNGDAIECCGNRCRNQGP